MAQHQPAPADAPAEPATPTEPPLGTLTWLRAVDHPELLAGPTHAALLEWARHDPSVAADVRVAEIDPEVSDTAAMSERYEIPMEASVNCVLVAGKREGVERTAAAAVRASTRADVNGAIKKLLDVRKASFVPTGRAVEESGMEYGGITPIGLPVGWLVLLDAAAADGWIVIGSGVRRSKIALPGELLASFPGVQVVEDLAR
ncbi:YbaK/EbsC family protein [Sanguibacter sp. 25GB23B1]|uniref:YbaK/EbsC family protein n=1 Tax=unclassified Sanguibacter TaxID=2645534 RepID=UPI0032AEBE4B